VKAKQLAAARSARSSSTPLPGTQSTSTVAAVDDVATFAVDIDVMREEASKRRVQVVGTIQAAVNAISWPHGTQQTLTDDCRSALARIQLLLGGGGHSATLSEEALAAEALGLAHHAICVFHPGDERREPLDLVKQRCRDALVWSTQIACVLEFGVDGCRGPVGKNRFKTKLMSAAAEAHQSVTASTAQWMHAVQYLHNAATGIDVTYASLALHVHLWQVANRFQGQFWNMDKANKRRAKGPTRSGGKGESTRQQSEARIDTQEHETDMLARRPSTEELADVAHYHYVPFPNCSESDCSIDWNYRTKPQEWTTSLSQCAWSDSALSSSSTRPGRPR
jgi:hypothetical protein